MRVTVRLCGVALFVSSAHAAIAQAPSALSWTDVRQRFESNNPTLRAAQLTVDEARANEITAGLRPNPQLSATTDQFASLLDRHWSYTTPQWTPTVTQLIERQGKRHLRYQSAQLITRGSAFDAQDLHRNLLLNLRDAFIRTLAAQSILQLTTDNLADYDTVLAVNRQRFQAGDLSRIDLQRLELQRAQFASDRENASVSLRQAKLDLRALLNDSVPVERFDVHGDFSFGESLPPLDVVREKALAIRPDLLSATTAVERAVVDHRLASANGSVDPIVGATYQSAGQSNTFGLSVGLPLRIFDRNQGEKARTDYERQRTARLREGVVIAVTHDVEAAHGAAQSVVRLLQPYRDSYLPQATQVRETIAFAFARGAASLLEFLDAERSYRETQLAYRQLIASYLSAVNQLNFTAGYEVLP